MNNLKLKNIPKLLEEYEKYSDQPLFYKDVILIEIIKNLNHRILELEHQELIKDMVNGKNKGSADSDT